jgi:nicotinamide riboside kinase
VPEYGRTYYEGKMYSVGSERWTTQEFFHIAEMQNKSEEALVLKSNRVLICDTDSFTTSIWHRRYMGRKTDKLRAIINQTKHDLYILTDTDIPFVQDGTRDGEHLRQWMHELFLKELSRTKRPFIVVSGDRKERLKQAVIKIDKLLSEEIKKYEFESRSSQKN